MQQPYLQLSSSAPRANNPLNWNGIPVRPATEINPDSKGIVFGHLGCTPSRISYADFRRDGYALCPHCGTVLFVYEVYVAQAAQGAALSAWGEHQRSVQAAPLGPASVRAALLQQFEMLRLLLGVEA